MNIFRQESILIKQIEQNMNSLDQGTINNLLNQQLFYHACQELPNYIPNQHTPPTSTQLINKVLRQIPPAHDLDQTIEQIQHRIGILLEESHDQTDWIRQKFEAEREKMRSSGAKVKEYQPLYVQQMRGMSMSTPLNKKVMSYFQTSTKDWNLQEVIADLISSVEATEGESENVEQEGEALQQQARIQLQRLSQQFKLLEDVFNFSK